MKLDLKELISKLTNTPTVIEQGTVDIWTYRKWSNGTAECWGTMSNSFSSWVSWGHIYETNTSVSRSYPTGLFTAAPVVSARAWSIAGYAFTEANGGSKTATPTCYALRATTATTGTFYVEIYAIGKWK